MYLLLPLCITLLRASGRKTKSFLESSVTKINIRQSSWTPLQYIVIKLFQTNLSIPQKDSIKKLSNQLPRTSVPFLNFFRKPTLRTCFAPLRRKKNRLFYFHYVTYQQDSGDRRRSVTGCCGIKDIPTRTGAPPPPRRRDGESNPSGDRSQSLGPLALLHLLQLCKKTARHTIHV